MSVDDFLYSGPVTVAPGMFAPVATLVLVSACLSVRDVPYTPDPDAIPDPLEALRAALQPSCRFPVAVAFDGAEVRITDRCWSDWRDRPIARSIDVACLTDVRIRFGDWHFVEVRRGERVLANVSFESKAHAVRAANALWSLSGRARMAAATSERCR